MDAKPQRPMRTLKIRDENIPPSIFPSKTIHQRNKSSPALSTLVQGNGIRVAGRRTAFADVSNIVKAVDGIRDDSAITSKTSYNKDTKDVETAQPAALSRPAQRPLSVSGLRGFFNNLTSNSSGLGPKSTTTEKPLEPQIVSANIRKPLARRATTVLRESEPGPIPAELPVTVEHPLPENEPPIVAAASSSRDDAQDYVSHIYEPAPVQATTGPPSTENWQDAISHMDEHLDVRSDGVKLSTANCSESVAVDALPILNPVEVYEDIQPDSQFKPHSDHLASHPPRRKSSAKMTEKDHLASVLSAPDPEDYWEHAVYDEPYQDESYTTARSFKSKGELTSNATMAIFPPKKTTKDERELTAAKLMVGQSRDAEEIEADEAWDTSMVAEYGEEIFEYMRKLEEQLSPNPHYMDNQTEVQWSMRAVLMDWLVQVHHRFSLLPETLFLCVNYIDRFLSCKVVSLGKLQLVGATAIFIAAKYEEINCPSIQEIVYMVDGGYTVDEILKAERFMLTMLQFELGWPGPMSFLRRISKADDYDLETRTLAKYFLELTIMDERFIACIPSYTAAGAHCLARLMLKKSNWTPAHVVYSNYTYSQLRPLLQAILSCCEDPQKHHSAIFNKYGDKRFKRASYFVQSEVAGGFVLPSSNFQMQSISNIGYDWANHDY